MTNQDKRMDRITARLEKLEQSTNITQQQGRPTGVWVISILFFLSGIIGLLIDSVIMPDFVGFLLVTNAICITGAILLFLLKRVAFYFFILDALCITLFIFYVANTSTDNTILPVALSILILICIAVYAPILLYIRKLVRLNILK